MQQLLPLQGTARMTCSVEKSSFAGGKRRNRCARWCKCMAFSTRLHALRFEDSSTCNVGDEREATRNPPTPVRLHNVVSKEHIRFSPRPLWLFFLVCFFHIVFFLEWQKTSPTQPLLCFCSFLMRFPSFERKPQQLRRGTCNTVLIRVSRLSYNMSFVRLHRLTQSCSKRTHVIESLDSLRFGRRSCLFLNLIVFCIEGSCCHSAGPCAHLQAKRAKQCYGELFVTSEASALGRTS